MRNICFYGGDISRLAGTERSMFTVANGLAKLSGNKIFIISFKGNRKDVQMVVDPRIEIICLGIENLKIGYPLLLWRLFRAIRDNDINILISVEMYTVFFTLPVVSLLKLLKYKIYYVAWEHFNFKVNLKRPLRDKCRRWAAKFADMIVVLTARDIGLWNQNLTVKGRIVNIINAFPFEIENNIYSKDSKIVLAIGRLTFQKGFDRLLDIWAKGICKFEELKDWKLLILGSGEDDLVLKRQSSELKINQYVSFISHVSNISEYYKSASFMVVTSRFEGLPMTMIEAQTFGLPLISYDCLTGPSDIISKKSGRLVDENDEVGFLNEVYEFIVNSELRLQMSTNARRESVRYSINNVINLWDDVLPKF